MSIKNSFSPGQAANRAFLKVKIRHLAIEPAIIRNVADQQRRRYQAWRSRQIASLKKTFDPQAQEQGFAEAKIGMPYEDPWAAVRLQWHKLKVLRPEARAAQLAYAFIRGKSYATTEAGAKSEPDWKRVGEIALKYGDFPQGTTKNEAQQVLLLWRDQSLEAKADKAA